MQALDLTDSSLADLRRDASNSSNLLTVKCDVSNDEQQISAFKQHTQRWGHLDIAILNAGITESGDVLSFTCINRFAAGFIL